MDIIKVERNNIENYMINLNEIVLKIKLEQESGIQNPNELCSLYGLYKTLRTCFYEFSISIQRLHSIPFEIWNQHICGEIQNLDLNETINYLNRVNSFFKMFHGHIQNLPGLYWDEPPPAEPVKVSLSKSWPVSGNKYAMPMGYETHLLYGDPLIQKAPFVGEHFEGGKSNGQIRSHHPAIQLNATEYPDSEPLGVNETMAAKLEVTQDTCPIKSDAHSLPSNFKIEAKSDKIYKCNYTKNDEFSSPEETLPSSILSCSKDLDGNKVLQKMRDEYFEPTKSLHYDSEPTVHEEQYSDDSVQANIENELNVTEYPENEPLGANEAMAIKLEVTKDTCPIKSDVHSLPSTFNIEARPVKIYMKNDEFSSPDKTLSQSIFCNNDLDCNDVVQKVYDEYFEPTKSVHYDSEPTANEGQCSVDLVLANRENETNFNAAKIFDKLSTDLSQLPKCVDEPMKVSELELDGKDEILEVIMVAGKVVNDNEEEDNVIDILPDSSVTDKSIDERSIYVPKCGNVTADNVTLGICQSDATEKELGQKQEFSDSGIANIDMEEELSIVDNIVQESTEPVTRSQGQSITVVDEIVAIDCEQNYAKTSDEPKGQEARYPHKENLKQYYSGEENSCEINSEDHGMETPTGSTFCEIGDVDYKENINISFNNRARESSEAKSDVIFHLEASDQIVGSYYEPGNVQINSQHAENAIDNNNIMLSENHFVEYAELVNAANLQEGVELEVHINGESSPMNSPSVERCDLFDQVGGDVLDIETSSVVDSKETLPSGENENSTENGKNVNKSNLQFPLDSTMVLEISPISSVLNYHAPSFTPSSMPTSRFSCDQFDPTLNTLTVSGSDADIVPVQSDSSFCSDTASEQDNEIPPSELLNTAKSPVVTNDGIEITLRNISMQGDTTTDLIGRTTPSSSTLSHCEEYETCHQVSMAGPSTIDGSTTSEVSFNSDTSSEQSFLSDDAASSIGGVSNGHPICSLLDDIITSTVDNLSISANPHEVVCTNPIYNALINQWKHVADNNLIDIKIIKAHYLNDFVGYCRFITKAADLQDENLIRLVMADNEIVAIELLHQN